MAQPVAVTKVLGAANDHNIAASQSLGAVGNLTLTASTVTLDTQRRVIITSAGNDSGLIWTIIGTTQAGAPIKDQFAGANTGIAQSNLDFYTITSIAGSGATAGNVTAGTNGVGSSSWKRIDQHIKATVSNFTLDLITGTGNASVDFTNDEVLGPTGSQPAIEFASANPVPKVYNEAGLLSQSSNAQTWIQYAPLAWRLTINSGTGTWQATNVQGGLAEP